ncbi:hypothetical protein EDB84DRAFT_1679595 [Lactarius hengduanensis]|nr:hypothetical protein EDB84DRAFT_1679595 [Lactarius hengduanensis]
MAQPQPDFPQLGHHHLAGAAKQVNRVPNTGMPVVNVVNLNVTAQYITAQHTQQFQEIITRLDAIRAGINNIQASLQAGMNNIQAGMNNIQAGMNNILAGQQQIPTQPDNAIAPLEHLFANLLTKIVCNVVMVQWLTRARYKPPKICVTRLRKRWARHGQPKKIDPVFSKAGIGLPGEEIGKSFSSSKSIAIIDVPCSVWTRPRHECKRLTVPVHGPGRGLILRNRGADSFHGQECGASWAVWGIEFTRLPQILIVLTILRVKIRSWHNWIVSDGHHSKKQRLEAPPWTSLDKSLEGFSGTERIRHYLREA